MTDVPAKIRLRDILFSSGVLGAIILPTLLVASVLWQDDRIAWTTRLIFAVGAPGVAAVAAVTSYRLHQWRDYARRLHAKCQGEATLRQDDEITAMSQIAGRFGNEFANIFSIITGSLHMLQHPGNEQFVTLGQNAVERGILVVQTLLAFARPPEPMRIEIFDLNGLITGMNGRLRQTLGPTITLHLQLSRQACWVRADRTQLERAIGNIVANSRDSMPTGGSLIIDTRHVVLSGTPDDLRGEFAMMTITDSGIGMSDDVLLHAADPFFTTKTRHTGTGISVVLGIAKQARGAMRITSVVAQGTTVTVWLPSYAQIGQRSGPAHA